MAMDQKSWEAVKTIEPDEGWEILPETGWFALLAWAAGVENIGRAPASDAGRTVRRTLLQDGVERSSAEPFTAADRNTVDESVNDFLRDAGVLARPSGFNWFLRIPEGWPVGLSLVDELASQVTAAWEHGTRPATLRPLFDQVVGGFYATAAP